MKYLLGVLAFCLLFIQCTDSSSEEKEVPKTIPFEAEAYALDGKPLVRIPDSPATFRKKDSLLQLAKADFETYPDSLESLIWY